MLERRRSRCDECDRLFGRNSRPTSPTSLYSRRATNRTTLAPLGAAKWAAPVLAARYLYNLNFHAAHSSAIGAAQTKLSEAPRGSGIQEGNHADRQVIGNRR